jgi:hypothetical protein
MKALAKVTVLGSAILMLAVLPARAQQNDGESNGVNSGDYNVHQTIEFGYRDTLINGNMNNYQTFENLGSGVRLFNYTLEMRSLDHQGFLFDNLSFSNFGYGGDPNNVTRLRMEKNKWYDLRGMFRRDENFWNYNLLANPLNPASSNPAVPIVNSPHAMHLVRRMQDYDLTLLPESRLRFRLGYSRNVNEGPGFTTFDGGTEPLLTENYKYTTNAYRAGVDFRFLPKTTFSFDELLTYFKQDSGVTDRNFPFVLSNDTPADLGIVFNTAGRTPCSMPILSPTKPPTANPNCNGYLAFSRVGRPRGSFPTEHFAFQSTYFKNLAMSGSVGYSHGDSSIPDFSEFVNGWTSRTVSRGSTVGGPADAKRVSVNADWVGDYRVTDRFHIVDEFRFDDWRTPSMWATANTNLFGTPPAAPGQAGLLLPIAQVNPANFATVCPTAPFNGPNCPQHSGGSLADVQNEVVSRFLGQKIKRNTFELEYEFSHRVNARIGYLYTARTIADFSATFDTGEIYFPGGSTGNAGNFFLAGRGDCTPVAGLLPAGCVLNPDGSVTEGSPSQPLPEAGSDTSRNFLDIHEHAFLAGVTVRPIDKLRLSADFLFGYNGTSFTRISPRHVQSYKLHAMYTPVRWASIDGAIDIHENRDNVATINNLEHGRTYSFATTLAPNPRLWVDFGYHYTDIFSQTDICFADPGSTVFTTPCPIPTSPGPLGARSFYKSTDHFAYGDLMWKPFKRVTTTLGFAGSIVRGNTLFINLLQPTGPVDFNYLKPYATLAFDLYKGFTYKTAWSYYGYNDHGVANPTGLATLPLQDFNGSNVTFSFRYAF